METPNRELQEYSGNIVGIYLPGSLNPKCNAPFQVLEPAGIDFFVELALFAHLRSAL